MSTRNRSASLHSSFGHPFGTPLRISSLREVAPRFQKERNFSQRKAGRHAARIDHVVFPTTLGLSPYRVLPSATAVPAPLTTQAKPAWLRVRLRPSRESPELDAPTTALRSKKLNRPHLFRPQTRIGRKTTDPARCRRRPQQTPRVREVSTLRTNRIPPSRPEGSEAERFLLCSALLMVSLSTTSARRN